MSTLPQASSIIQELERTLQGIRPGEMEKLAKQIMQAEQIFVAGAGRSGLMMKAFAMRLMHMGLRAYVVGETVTPGITERDLLLIGSGSGETKTLVSMAAKASSIGAAIGVVTIVPASTLGTVASLTVTIPAVTKDNPAGGSNQPMGTLFEQSLLIMLDTIVMNLMETLQLEGTGMYGNHANLE
ncbi:6-phospho-3-hexuloisomerase [Paenibacillus glycanilyticus]|uniref:3-hexulose-6-phosphate isomerase n=1 Tax=Paenibacillus glycanilyticus TaxID=126569 RepID=A0ABQ6G9Y5_9BACL|nr:6-phospho-3-hexuloisomerase [Paenibacillus glycanilyticus]GLX67723.1 3-hexulose-6-phosphate isomerase [Paenibacillus glycanilyticus]